MSSHPSLTVVLPAHNAEATIAPAIASTLNQSYTDFDLWVLENGSTDATAEVAKSFSDSRLHVFELGPVGFQGALQYAIENAQSDWLARMDADDLMFPDRLKVEMRVIAQHPEIVFVASHYALLTPLGSIFERLLSVPSREVDTSSLSRGRFFADPSTIFRRRTALNAGGVDPEFTSGDLPLLFRLLTYGKGWEIAEPLHLYRIQPNSMCRSTDFRRQGLRVRSKYAPQTVDPSAEVKDEVSAWAFILGLELLAGNGPGVRQAANYLEQTGTKANWARWLSYFGRLGYHYLRLWDCSGFRYRHRPDWETLFKPLMKLEPSEIPQGTLVESR
jgi:glycosyltransferase involved in cell wall biosynthesis